MLTTVRTLADTAYQTLRYQLMSLVEGNELLPYLDSSGIPSIGIGANLQANLVPAITAMGLTLDQATIDRLQNAVDNGVYASNQALQNTLNAIVAPRAFALADQNQSLALFNAIAPQYESSITNGIFTRTGVRVTNPIPNFQNSVERAAAFAVAFEGAGSFGPRLVGALNGGNRAEAWYEIRYNTNSVTDNPAASRPGLAKRWYIVSQIFGLYEHDTQLTDGQKDAAYKNIFAMYTRHLTAPPLQASIQTYDTFGRTPSITVGTPLNTQLISPIQAANNALTASALVAALPANTNLGQVQPLTNANGTQDLSGDLQIAANFLEARYAPGATIGQIFAAPDTALALDPAITTVDRSQDTINDLIFGGQGNDTIYGGSGNDIIFGSVSNDSIFAGQGADTLVGGFAINTLNGGDGNDTFFLNGTGYQLVTQNPNAPIEWLAPIGNSGPTIMNGGRTMTRSTWVHTTSPMDLFRSTEAPVRMSSILLGRCRLT
jgi:hypothetical protein